MMDEIDLYGLMEEAFDGWKSVQDLEYMSIREAYKAGYMHGVQDAEETENDR